MKYKILSLTPSLCLSLTHIQITKHNGSEPVSGTGVCRFTSSCQWKGECCLLYVLFIWFHLLLLWCMYSPHVGVKWAAASRDEKLNQCQTALPIAARLALNAKVVKANMMPPIYFALCTLLVYFGARNYVTWVKALSAITANVCSLYIYIYIDIALAPGNFTKEGIWVCNWAIYFSVHSFIHSLFPEIGCPNILSPDWLADVP